MQRRICIGMFDRTRAHKQEVRERREAREVRQRRDILGPWIVFVALIRLSLSVSIDIAELLVFSALYEIGFCFIVL